MKRQRTYSTAVILAVFVAAGFVAATAVTASQVPGTILAESPGQDPVYQDLPKSGKKCWIGEDHYFIHAFDKSPKMGTSILKIELFDKAGNRVTDMTVTGRSDMPSMRGAHDSGDVAFKKNRQGDYLLPVNIVMPGDWEVLLVFSKGDTVVFRGRVTFEV